jgi:hypothetical protein
VEFVEIEKWWNDARGVGEELPKCKVLPSTIE